MLVRDSRPDGADPEANEMYAEVRKQFKTAAAK